MKKILYAFVLSLLLCSAFEPAPKATSGRLKNCYLRIGQLYAGGIIFYVDPHDDCHGLVCAPSNQSGSVDWNDAVHICSELKLGGYTDWRLPDKDELNGIYTNLYKTKLAEFPVNYYWSATQDDRGMAYAQYFSGSSQNIYRYVYKKYTFSVRAVRAF